MRTLVRVSDVGALPVITDDAVPSRRHRALRRTGGDRGSPRAAVRLERAARREILDELRRPRGRVVRAPPGSQLARALARSRLGQHALDGQAHRTRRAQAPRDAHADAGPVDARRALVHVAGRGHDDDGAAAGQRAGERAVAAVADHHVARRHDPRVGEPLDQARVAGDVDRLAQRPAVPGGEHAHRRVGEPAQRRAQQPVRRVLRGRGRHQHQRIVAGGQRDVGGRRLPQQRPHGVRGGQGDRARVLERREGRHQRQLRRDPAVHAIQRPEPQPPPGLVELAAPALQPGVRHARQPAPQLPPQRRPRPARTQRERRPAALGARIEVGDDRRHRHALELGGQRRRQGQDVGHHRIGGELRHQRPRLARRPQHRLVGLQRPLARGEDVVLGRRLEAHARGPHVVLPALPGLQHHLVPARRERAAQRDQRERVPGVAEGAQQQPQRSVRRRQAPRRAAAARGARPGPTPSG